MKGALRHWKIAYSNTTTESTDTSVPRYRGQRGYADKTLINVLDYLATRFHLIVHGSEATFRCPFHEDSTPSLSFNLNQRVFYCHGCGESGDVLTFHMKVSGLSFKDACKDLGCWVER